VKSLTSSSNKTFLAIGSLKNEQSNYYEKRYCLGAAFM